jgi:hypothetical protein
VFYNPTVQSKKDHQPRRIGDKAAACLMLGLWLVTFALTISPALHHLLHADSQSGNHVCLITQIKQHPLVATFSLVATPLPVTFAAEIEAPADLAPPRTLDFCAFQSRGPPSLPLSSPAVG